MANRSNFKRSHDWSNLSSLAESKILRWNIFTGLCPRCFFHSTQNSIRYEQQFINLVKHRRHIIEIIDYWIKMIILLSPSDEWLVLIEFFTVLLKLCQLLCPLYLTIIQLFIICLRKYQSNIGYWSFSDIKPLRQKLYHIVYITVEVCSSDKNVLNRQCYNEWGKTCT